MPDATISAFCIEGIAREEYDDMFERRWRGHVRQLDATHLRRTYCSSRRSYSCVVRWRRRLVTLDILSFAKTPSALRRPAGVGRRAPFTATRERRYLIQRIQSTNRMTEQAAQGATHCVDAFVLR